MLSESLQCANIVNSDIDKFDTTQTSFFTTLIRKVTDALTRSEIERAQASYRKKRVCETQSELYQDIVGTLPVEEKLGLGMYRFMQ